jgi:Tfp pilus assembly protein PilP
MSMRPSTVAFVVWALGTTPADASQGWAAAAKPPAEKGPAAPAPAAPVQAPAGAPAPAPPPPPAEAYSYESGGRRDPFVNLLGAGSDVKVLTKRGDGSAALTVAEISVRGVMKSHGEMIAMVQGPDAKTYVVHQGDKFADGAIKNITAEGLIVVQEVNDPLSLVKQREIRKLLRTLEDTKQ